MRYFALVVCFLFASCLAQVDPECLNTIGTQITFTESDQTASLNLNGHGDFQVFPNDPIAGAQLTLEALLQGSPTFSSELGIGYSQAECTGSIRFVTRSGNDSNVSSQRSDLEAFLGQRWVSLTNSIIPPAASFSSVSTCGGIINETFDRKTSCDNLFLRSSLVDPVLQGSLRNIADLANPSTHTQYSAINRLHYAMFGTKRTDFFTANEVVVLRSLLPSFSGVFDFAQFFSDGPASLAINPLTGNEYYFTSYNGLGRIYYGCSYVSHICKYVQIGATLAAPQLFIDSYGAMHLIYYSSNDELNYTFCTNFASLLASSCNTTTINSGSNVQKSYLSQSVGYPHLKVVSNGDLFSIVTLVLNANVVSNSGLIFQIFSCKPHNPAGSAVNSKAPWFCLSNHLPRSNDQLTISAPIYHFDAQMTVSGGLVITYGYVNYAIITKRSEKTHRSVGDIPDAPNQSRADYVFRIITCPNYDCHTYSTKQILDSNPVFQKNFGAIPRGIRVKSTEGVNNGYPTIFFSFGSSDQSAFVTTPFYGGPIAIFNCLDASCNTASMVKSSDSLSGHVGEFDAIVTSTGLLLASPARRGTNWSPVFQYFTNSNASPNGQACTISNTGTLLLIDNQVYVCSKIQNSPIADAVIIYYWSPLAHELRSQLNNSPQSYQTTLLTSCPSRP